MILLEISRGTKLALGVLGTLGAGAGTYYAAKNGYLGDAAQNLAYHGSTEPLVLPEPKIDPKDRMEAALDAAKIAGEEFSGAVTDYARDNKGAVAGSAAGAVSGLGMRKVYNDALLNKLGDDAANKAKQAFLDRQSLIQNTKHAFSRLGHGDLENFTSSARDAFTSGKNFYKNYGGTIVSGVKSIFRR